MSIAASDQQLAIAMFKQACFDCLNGDRIVGERNEFRGALALCLAQSQQACEKALKGWIYFQVGTAEYCKPTHLVWSHDLRIESLYPANPGKRVWSSSTTETLVRELRQKLEQIVDPVDCNAIQEIEDVAPFRSWGKPNSEYPWIDSHGVVQIPAEYFDEQFVVKMNRLSHRVIKEIAGSTDNPKFYNEFRKIKLSFDAK